MSERTVSKRARFPSKSAAVKARSKMLSDGVPCGTPRYSHMTHTWDFLHWHSGPKVNYA